MEIKTSEFKLLLIIIALTVLAACSPESKKIYTEIKFEYDKIIEETSYEEEQINSINFLKEKIKHYQTEFPNSKYDADLEIKNQNLKIRLFEISIKKLEAKHKELQENDIADYDLYLTELRQILDNGEKQLEEAPTEKSKDELNKLIKQLKEEESKIITEENDYKQLKEDYRKRYTHPGANKEIDQINNFLATHFKSIKRKELELRIKRLEYIKFQFESEKEIKTIKELNQLIQTLEEKLTKIPNFEKESAEKTIARIQNRRQEILSSEYSTKKNQIETKMKTLAEEEFKSKHEKCGFKPENPTIEKRSSTEHKQSLNLLYHYHFKISCGFVCDTRKSTTIEVEAKLSGNENDGVMEELSACQI